ncbi:hypothetical protein F5888DRAFT_945612 [Russula emetica]|nr:hypothetical protein F5888DRAFT_945612 [Russula emetica]
MLIEHGADVTAQDNNRQTPSHLASKMGRVDVARMLIERGADVMARDTGRDGLPPPLHLASESRKGLRRGSVHTQSTLQNENDRNANKSCAVGDTPELGPGTILGPSGPSGSASTGPTNAYPSTPAASPSSYSTSSVSRDSSSNSAAPIPISGHSSNMKAIAGGIAGGIAATSIVIAALLFYL